MRRRRRREELGLGSVDCGLKGLGERRELPHRVASGARLSRKRIWPIFSITEHF